jgi:hypothetical protein
MFPVQKEVLDTKFIRMAWMLLKNKRYMLKMWFICSKEEISA